MFKRPPKLAGSATAIRSSDRRKLIAQICSSYPSLSADEAKNLVPDGIRQQKFTTNAGASGTLYSCPADGAPLWVYTENRTMPTVFALARSERPFLPIVPLWDPPPDPFLAGAALFFAAVRFRDSERLADIAQHDIVAYMVIDHDEGLLTEGRLIGVGQLCSSGGLKEALLQHQVAHSSGGQAGRLCETISMVDDGLWTMITKEAAQDMRSRLNRAQRYGGALHTDIAALELSDDPQQCAAEAVPRSTQNASLSPELKSSQELKDMSSDEVDQILWDSLLQALPTIPMSSLPLPFSTFYSQFVLPNRPATFLSREGEVVIARSSYKKLSKWLKSTEKGGLIKIKETRDGNGHVISINLEHDAIQNHKSHTTIAKAAVQRRGQDPQVEADSVDVAEFWLPDGAGLSFWANLGYNKSSRLTAVQLSSEVSRYARERNLGSDPRNPTDLRQIRLDEDLCRATTGKLEDTQTVWRRDKVLDGVRSMMAPIHTVNGVVRKGLAPSISWVVKKKAGKKVTEIQGVETYLDVNQVANDLKIKFQGSSTVGPLIPGARSSKMLITIQGDQAKHLPEFFSAAGINKKFYKH